jgi:hypothetical protein
MCLPPEWQRWTEASTNIQLAISNKAWRLYFHYLHIGLLCVHKLLDDFSKAVCIRQVAGQRPGRWVLTFPWCLHAFGLGVVEAPAQCSDLFSTLRDDKRWKVMLRTLVISISCTPGTLSVSTWAQYSIRSLTWAWVSGKWPPTPQTTLVII